MKALKFTQIFIILLAVIVKNLIFSHFGWEYDILEDGFDLKMIVAHIGALIIIIFGVSYLFGLAKND